MTKELFLQDLTAKERAVYELYARGYEDSTHAANEQSTRTFYQEPPILSKEDLELLKSFRRMGNRLICSVPNEDLVKWGKETHPWHFRHYTTTEIHDKLAQSGWMVAGIYGAPNGKSPLEKNYIGKNIILDCV